MLFFFRKNIARVRTFHVPDAETPENMEIIRRDCPGNCTGGIDFLMFGNKGAAEAELDRSPDIWNTKGVVGGINYLVDIQHRATPESVGGPVAILRIDKSGSFQWLQHGICN